MRIFPAAFATHLTTAIIRTSIVVVGSCGFGLPLTAQDDEPTRLAASGRITEINADAPRTIIADLKMAGATTSMPFLVAENCRVVTSGLGVFGELKRGDNIKIEYTEKEGGAREAVEVVVVNAPVVTPPKTTALAPKSPAKKPAGKKPPAKPAPKKN